MEAVTMMRPRLNGFMERAAARSVSIHAAEIDVEDALPIVEADILQLAGFDDKAAPGADARVGKHDVGCAQRGCDLVEKGIDGRFLADVDQPVMHGAEPGFALTLGRALQCRGIVIDHHDGRTRLEQHFGHGQAQAAGRARDQGQLSAHIEHRRSGAHWTPLRAARSGIRAWARLGALMHGGP